MALAKTDYAGLWAWHLELFNFVPVVRLQVAPMPPEGSDDE